MSVLLLSQVGVKWGGVPGSAVQGFSTLPGGRGAAGVMPQNFGSFYKLYDETAELAAQQAAQQGSRPSSAPRR